MKKILLSLFTIFSILTTANAESYTHTFKDGDLTSNGGTTTLTDVDWNSSKATEGSEVKWSNGKGFQIGSKQNPCTSYSLSTSAFNGFKITSVTVYSTIASSGDAKLTIKAGNTTSEEFTLTGTNTGYTLNCNEQGDIVISWKAGQRAYYVSKIEVVYELPSDMVDVEEPTFTTTTECIYTEKVTVWAETKDKNLSLYYTLDGTDPSYEDFNSDPAVGTTKCSKGFQMNPTLTDSTTIHTIKVMAVKVDGESVYKSDIVEGTFIVSPKKLYTAATTVTNGNRYAFFANDSIADALNPKIGNGYLCGRKTAKLGNCYEAAEYNAFTFTASDNGYTILDAAGRYMYSNGTSNELFFTAEKPEAGAVWSVTIDNDGKATIKNGNRTVYYSVNNDIFGCYETAETDMELPTLCMKYEYPQAIITPENGSTVQGLKEFTIYCSDGIAVSDNFSLKAQGNQKEDRTYEIDKIYNLTQVDNNTLKFTIEDELYSVDNIQIDMIITGKIYLSPDVLSYPIPIINKWANNICSYTHKGADIAPAELLSVTPENNSTIEELSHFVFTFSKIGTSVSEDGELQPRLYAEGISWNYILENTQTNSDDKMIAMDQLALKTSEPILGNGTYILEIPTGYFIDRNGNDLEGITLKFTVTNDSGLPADIEDIVEENNKWTVYNTNGIKVLETEDAGKMSTLPSGIYIINGTKVIIK